MHCYGITLILACLSLAVVNLNSQKSGLVHILQNVVCKKFILGSFSVSSQGISLV